MPKAARDRAKVRDILHAAGVTAPVLHHHFGDKEGVFLALVRASLAERANRVDLYRALGGGREESE